MPQGTNASVYPVTKCNRVSIQLTLKADQRRCGSDTARLPAKLAVKLAFNILRAVNKFVPDFFHSMSLKTRILLLVLVLLVAGIWGVAARTAAVMQADLEQLLSDQMSATVNYIATDIDAKIQLRMNLLSEI